MVVTILLICCVEYILCFTTICIVYFIVLLLFILFNVYYSNIMNGREIIKNIVSYTKNGDIQIMRTNDKLLGFVIYVH
jgi:hypothetical protein